MIPGLGRSPGEGNGNPLQYSAWRIPWTEELGGLQSTGSQRVGHAERLTCIYIYAPVHIFALFLHQETMTLVFWLVSGNTVGIFKH